MDTPQPDCRDYEISVMINRYCKGKMPENGNWGKYHSSFKPLQTTARGLAIEVYKGYSFCPMYKGRRRKTNFREAWHIGVDFDSKCERSSLDYLSREDYIDFYASFGYTTPSHTVEEPKARIIWIFPDPITDYETYESLAKALLWRFDWADTSAKDALRLFFGSPNCQVWDNWSIFPEVAWRYLIDSYKKDNPPPPPRTTVQVSAKDISNQFTQSFLDDILSDLKAANDGEKHPELIKTAYTLGGYIAGGYYVESDIRKALRSIVDNMHNVKNVESAYKTIDDGVADGKLKPLYFDRPLGPGDKM